ncbi:hypothetical protein [Streptomyces sp. NPDC014622]|uniref:hypothetical protein n=1 Tax=Streptomyces sp. NPDC014622 TaxID=3364874 RepID=UPI00370142B9
MDGIRKGDRVTHWTRLGQVGEVVRVESPRTGGTVTFVAWPGSDILVPYAAHHSLTKHEDGAL